MGYKFNPFTGNFDATDSPNGEFESLSVSGIDVANFQDRISALEAGIDEGEY